MRIFQWNNSAVVFAHGDNMWQPTKCERRLEWSSTSLLPTTCHNHHSGFCRLMIRIGTILGTYWNQHCYRITNFLQFCYLQPQHRSISRPFFLFVSSACHGKRREQTPEPATVSFKPNVPQHGIFRSMFLEGLICGFHENTHSWSKALQGRRPKP